MRTMKKKPTACILMSKMKVISISYFSIYYDIIQLSHFIHTLDALKRYIIIEDYNEIDSEKVLALHIIIDITQFLISICSS